MKRIEELGISPAPWKVIDPPDDSLTVEAPDGCSVCFMGGVIETPANARLVAAAPKLYQALYDLIGIVRNRLPKQPTIDEIEAVRNAEKALAEAAGEEVAKCLGGE